MKYERFLFDANALISFFTDRIREQTIIVSSYIEKASNLDCEILVTQSVLNDVVFVLEDIYEFAPKAIIPALGALLRNPGIRLVHGSYPQRALELWSSNFKDYGDALLSCAAEDLQLAVYTFDKPFFKELKRAGIAAKLLG